MGSFSNLQHLSLRACSALEELLPSIGNCHKLKYLNLESCPKLKSLPNSIVECEQLTHLYVSYSGICELPH